MSDFPVIRLELERMKVGICAALTEELLKIDVDLRKAVEKVCTPQYIGAQLEKEVQKAIDSGIKRELEDFFHYGNGRKVLRAAIEERFKEAAP